MKKALVMILVLLLISARVSADNRTIYLTSLDWPPYTAEKIKFQGMTSVILTTAFKEMGYEVKIDFYPWQRAVKSAKEGEKYIGYFPEYYSKDIENNFWFSDPIGEGPLGLVERKDGAIKWKSIKELANYKIGIVTEYVNTEEFDKMVERKELKTEDVTSDIQNLKKVSAKRIEAAVIDRNVMEYFFNTDTSGGELRKTLQFNEKILENKKLYVCFRKNEEGQKYLKILNQGLKKINVLEIEKNYLINIKKNELD